MVEHNPQTLRLIQVLDIALIILLPLYFLAAGVAFFCSRTAPSIRVRLPSFVLISVFGMLLFVIFNLLIGIVSNRSVFEERGHILVFFKLGCVFSQLIESVIEVLVVAPLFLRFHYTYKISLMIHAFHKDVSSS